MIRFAANKALAALLLHEARKTPPHHLHSVCAWCLPGVTITNGPTSHRLCRRCSDRETAALGGAVGPRVFVQAFAADLYAAHADAEAAGGLVCAAGRWNQAIRYVIEKQERDSQ